MQQPQHSLIANRRHGAMSPERMTGIMFVALLHVAAISALIFGLKQHYFPERIPGPTVVDFLPPKPPPPQPPIKVTLIKPIGPTAPEPKIPTIQDQDSHTIHVGLTPPTGGGDGVALQGITSTHTIPPYPAAELRLGVEGTVLLRLTVTPQGTVSAAEVERSSDDKGLDDAAIAWVIAHWRYQPATQNGQPVAAMTRASLVFNVKSAR
jgi:protein TonB